MTWVAQVVVTLKPVVNDPQGIVIREGLHQLGFAEVEQVRAGKYLEITLDAADEPAARRRLVRMCEELLRNPVIEDYAIASLAPVASAAAR
ncbi:MAG: phosphoribosylformylglycinamidine synthase subunit PurS [Candidatus Dormibacteria bacterium]